jgi:hypothetical protein
MPPIMDIMDFIIIVRTVAGIFDGRFVMPPIMDFIIICEYTRVISTIHTNEEL